MSDETIKDLAEKFAKAMAQRTRDDFAAAALQGLLAEGLRAEQESQTNLELVVEAWAVADLMMAERAKRGGLSL